MKITSRSQAIDIMGSLGATIWDSKRRKVSIIGKSYKFIRQVQRPDEQLTEIQRLKDILCQVVWVQPLYNGSPSCSYCGSQKHFGHSEGCAIEMFSDDKGGEEEEF
jgi:hypothetical protein